MAEDFERYAADGEGGKPAAPPAKAQGEPPVSGGMATHPHIPRIDSPFRPPWTKSWPQPQAMESPSAPSATPALDPETRRAAHARLTPSPYEGSRSAAAMAPYYEPIRTHLEQNPALAKWLAGNQHGVENTVDAYGERTGTQPATLDRHHAQTLLQLLQEGEQYPHLHEMWHDPQLAMHGLPGKLAEHQEHKDRIKSVPIKDSQAFERLLSGQQTGQRIDRLQVPLTNANYSPQQPGELVYFRHGGNGPVARVGRVLGIDYQQPLQATQSGLLGRDHETQSLVGHLIDQPDAPHARHIWQVLGDRVEELGVRRATVTPKVQIAIGEPTHEAAHTAAYTAGYRRWTHPTYNASLTALNGEGEPIENLEVPADADAGTLQDALQRFDAAEAAMAQGQGGGWDEEHLNESPRTFRASLERRLHDAQAMEAAGPDAERFARLGQNDAKNYRPFGASAAALQGEHRDPATRLDRWLQEHHGGAARDFVQGVGGFIYDALNANGHNDLAKLPPQGLEHALAAQVFDQWEQHLQQHPTARWTDLKDMAQHVVNAEFPPHEPTFGRFDDYIGHEGTDADGQHFQGQGPRLQHPPHVQDAVRAAVASGTGFGQLAAKRTQATIARKVPSFATAPEGLQRLTRQFLEKPANFSHEIRHHMVGTNLSQDTEQWLRAQGVDPGRMPYMDTLLDALARENAHRQVRQQRQEQQARDSSATEPLPDAYLRRAQRPERYSKGGAITTGMGLGLPIDTSTPRSLTGSFAGEGGGVVGGKAATSTLKDPRLPQMAEPIGLAAHKKPSAAGGISMTDLQQLKDGQRGGNTGPGPGQMGQHLASGQADPGALLGGGFPWHAARPEDARALHEHLFGVEDTKFWGHVHNALQQHRLIQGQPHYERARHALVNAIEARPDKGAIPLTPEIEKEVYVLNPAVVTPRGQRILAKLPQIEHLPGAYVVPHGLPLADLLLASGGVQPGAPLPQPLAERTADLLPYARETGGQLDQGGGGSGKPGAAQSLALTPASDKPKGKQGGSTPTPAPPSAEVLDLHPLQEHEKQFALTQAALPKAPPKAAPSNPGIEQPHLAHVDLGVLSPPERLRAERTLRKFKKSADVPGAYEVPGGTDLQAELGKHVPVKPLFATAQEGRGRFPPVATPADTIGHPLVDQVTKHETGARHVEQFVERAGYQTMMDEPLQIGRTKLTPNEANRSSLRTLYNNELPRNKANINLATTIHYLNDRARRLSPDGKPLDIRSKGGQEKNLPALVRILTAEAEAAIAGKDNAKFWYRDKVGNAVKINSLWAPEILNDPIARMAWAVALSVTSQGNKVSKNVEHADKAYRYFQQHGRMDDTGWEKIHNKGNNWNDNFSKFNKLIGGGSRQELETARRFLDKMMPASEFKQMGYKADEEDDALIPGSTLFGSKIGGGFYQNLMGNYRLLTADMWVMRQIGRLTGTLLNDDPATIQANVERFRRALIDPEAHIIDPENKRHTLRGQRVPHAVHAALMGGEHEHSLHELMHDDLALYRYASEVYQHYSRSSTPGINSFADKNEYNRAAKSLVEVINQPQDGPYDGPFRTYLRQAFGQALQHLHQAGHTDLELADLQALLWYPEKELYVKLGHRAAGRLSMDYEQGMRKIAQERGLSEAEVQAALLRESKV